MDTDMKIKCISQRIQLPPLITIQRDRNIIKMSTPMFLGARISMVQLSKICEGSSSGNSRWPPQFLFGYEMLIFQVVDMTRTQF